MTLFKIEKINKINNRNYIYTSKKKRFCFVWSGPCVLVHCGHEQSKSSCGIAKVSVIKEIEKILINLFANAKYRPDNM